MTHTELDKLLRSSGLPVAYHHFGKPQNPPFLVYIRTGSENIGADNRTYCKRNNYDVELYTDKKDTAKEALIESLLDSNDIYYDIDEVYIENEKMYEVIYSIQI